MDNFIDLDVKLRKMLLISKIKKYIKILQGTLLEKYWIRNFHVFAYTNYILYKQTVFNVLRSIKNFDMLFQN